MIYPLKEMQELWDMKREIQRQLLNLQCAIDDDRYPATIIAIKSLRLRLANLDLKPNKPKEIE